MVLLKKEPETVVDSKLRGILAEPREGSEGESGIYDWNGVIT
jgi:hypothetical protein